MILNLRKYLKIILPVTVVRILKQFENFITLSLKYGQFNSIIKNSSIDRFNKPIPWISYPAIEFLNQFNLKNIKVLEYGSGNSTIYFSKKVKYIVSIEHNKKYFKKNFEKVKKLNNTKLLLKNNKLDYCAQPIKFLNSEIIIIDGIFRKECIKYIISNKKKIKNNIIIIIDNSNWLPKSVELLSKELNYTRVDFMGFSPINNYCISTTILINKKNKFFKRKSINISPIGEIKHTNHDKFDQSDNL